MDSIPAAQVQELITAFAWVCLLGPAAGGMLWGFLCSLAHWFNSPKTKPLTPGELMTAASALRSRATALEKRAAKHAQNMPSIN